MRKFFLRATLLTVLLAILGGVLMLFLSQVRPFRPGNVVFPVQYLAERQRSGLTVDSLNHASYELTILGRRIDDLIARTGTRHELTAVRYLDLALDHAAEAVARAVTDHPEAEAELRIRLLALVRQFQEALAALQIVPEENPDIYQALQAKIKTLALILENETADLTNLERLSTIKVDPSTSVDQSPTPAGVSLLAPQGIPFPEGSVAAQHSFYPLVGQHALLECTSCHVNEQYAGTPTQCVVCHQNKAPLNHFEGDCATCHTPLSWQDATFDHALYGATDCVSCHTGDKPANHFDGQCSACHTTTAWKPASFDHSLVNATDCQSCHSDDAPPNHYAGQCSACHNTSSWANVNFDHNVVNATNCQSCHGSDAPANHYAGQCSNCHTSTSNWGSVSFNHTGQTDCQACHGGDAPANHYAGQCSNCHTSTSNWGSVSFSHTGQTNCSSCHTPPANHYAGQCSTCHNTSNWNDASFNHTGQTDCQACHGGDAPANHYAGQCSNCHTSTSNWGSVNFSHTGQANCSSC
ncbi:MAG TPA: hypothetical protein VI451_13125, partial [Anaerolineales bacterium]|nr:hypothetical protein [Anaerolineales bacterium]